MQNLFPRILRRALKGLSNEKRQLIISYIIIRGSVAPRDIERSLNIKSNDLSYHLRNLVLANLLERKIVNGEVRYKLSYFGTKLLTYMFRALAPIEHREIKEVSVKSIYLPPEANIDSLRDIYIYNEKKEQPVENLYTM